MSVNVGNIDRVIRFLIGVLAIAAIFVGPFAGAGWERIALGIVGAIMIGTSVFKFCPLYRIFGLNTCKI
jgi:hypothetical protein